jgi:hypothetical protein
MLSDWNGLNSIIVAEGRAAGFSKGGIQNRFNRRPPLPIIAAWLPRGCVGSAQTIWVEFLRQAEFAASSKGVA